MNTTFNLGHSIYFQALPTSATSERIAFNQLEILKIMQSDSKELLRSVNTQRGALGLPAVNIQLIPVNGNVYAKLDRTNPNGTGFAPFDNSGRVFINADNRGLALTRDRSVLRHLLLHEMIHAATSTFGVEVNRLTAKSNPLLPSGVSIRDAVIEGLTDVAATLMTKIQSPFDNYAPHRATAEKLIDLVGADNARRALFGGDKVAIGLLMNAIRQMAAQETPTSERAR